MFALIVTEPFADFTKGDVIREDVETVLSANPGRVVHVMAEAVAASPISAPPVETPSAPLAAPPSE